MDWMRLFALLVAVASLHVSADGSKKKIRIHLPQKVKHIHHHKKIYITNHHASSQYAPAYIPSAEGAVAVPTNVALPSVANVLPLNSVELYDDTQPHFPGPISPAASKILPLYHARGYYGPTPNNDWDEQEYDVAPQPEPTDNSYPSSVGPTSTPKHPPKRVKIIKVNEQPPKKGTRKHKPKRVPVRARPPTEDEHPVSKYHEQFYSDLDGTGTIRKVKKPQRVEKIIDGDTEHIHTYSEEHIHKLLFDDESKLPGVVGVDPVSSSSINAAQPLIPLKSSLIAIPSSNFPGLATIGSLGTPSQFEYASYNPRDVTHDHIFHDHGEIPPDVDLSREPLGFPPKVSYNSQGLRISDGASASYKRYKNKYGHKYSKPTKSTPSNDLSYYESLYSPISRLKKQLNHSAISHFESSVEPNYDLYRTIPAINFLGKPPKKIRSTYSKTQQLHDHRSQYPQSPFAVSSTIIHDYQPKPSYPGALPPTGFSSFKDPIVNFKDSYSNNYDTYASSSNLYTSEDKNNNVGISGQHISGKKKSISTQNISFGRQDHSRIADNIDDDIVSSESVQDEPPSAFEDDQSYDKNKISDTISPTPYTIKNTSPAHMYYTAMAIKALYNEEPASMPEASNDNLQYAEAPSTTTFAPTVATTTASPDVYFAIQNPSITSPEQSEPSNLMPENEHRARKKHRHTMPSREPNQRSVIQDLRSVKEYEAEDRQPLPHKLFHHNRQVHESGIDTVAKGKLRYGDKI